MYIYKTTNLLNNKVYIGKSEKLFNEKYYGSGLLLKKAIKKYGIENFLVELLEVCETIEILNEREKWWIAQYINNSYNIAEGGSGGNTMKNHPNKNEIYKQNSKLISNTLKGHSVSKEQKEKQSKSHSGWFQRMTEEEQIAYRQKMSERMKSKYENGHPSKGKKLTDEHKNKLSIKAKQNGLGGNVYSLFDNDKMAIVKEKMSKSKIGKKLSNETKEKISKSLKNRNYKNE